MDFLFGSDMPKKRKKSTAVTLSDLEYLSSFEKKSEAQSFADKQRKKYKYVRVVKASSQKKIFYRVYVGN
jgi:hypothetical protein